jgi:hypothetical protein
MNKNNQSILKWVTKKKGNEFTLVGLVHLKAYRQSGQSFERKSWVNVECRLEDVVVNTAVTHAAFRIEILNVDDILYKLYEERDEVLAIQIHHQIENKFLDRLKYINKPTILVHILNPSPITPLIV